MATDSTQGKEFLGAGLAFPLEIDSSGQMKLNGLEDHVRQSIRLILQTDKGERVMRPDFGAGIQQLVFSSITAATAALVQHQVTDALVRYEPRIEVLSVDVSVDPQNQGVLLANIQYRVRRTDTTFNLVYPFYLEKGIV
jgi:phage baseplate assembly protein W